MRVPTVVDLFCGAGGLSHGFLQAGFDVRFGTDVESTFGKTFLSSHLGAKFAAKPIQALTVDEALQASKLEVGELDVLVGGPPCQGYSVYNHGRGEQDPRAGLFREYLRLVRGLQPKWLVMENVTGLLSISGGRLLASILSEIKASGYENADYRIIKAEEYGVPQERRRIIFIANRLDLPIEFPLATHDGVRKPYTNVWDAIGDLPPIEATTNFIDGAPYACKAMNSYQSMMRQSCELVPNHYGPRLSKVNMERIRHIPSGGSWRDIPFDLLPAGMKKAKRSDHTKRYGRPRPTDLACTILTKCDIHWGAFLHPIQNRAFSVREAARLQSFPDSFEFHGSMTEQFVQVGNAVPPLVAKSIAEAILKAGLSQLSVAA